MAELLDRQLAAALQKRLAVFAPLAADGSLLGAERVTELQTAAYLISESVRPCCCMFCNKSKLQELIRLAGFCDGNEFVEQKLAQLVYDELARCNGLG